MLCYITKVNVIFYIVLEYLNIMSYCNLHHHGIIVIALHCQIISPNVILTVTTITVTLPYTVALSYPNAQ